MQTDEKESCFGQTIAGWVYRLIEAGIRFGGGSQQPEDWDKLLAVKDNAMKFFEQLGNSHERA